MNRVFHIFQKDVIRLWRQILIFWFLLALNGWNNREAMAPGPTGVQGIAGLLLQLACPLLIISLIHEERLAGDTQYWLSRPISRGELIGAKILFLLFCVNLPVFVLDADIAVYANLPLSQNLANLLWLQVFFTVLRILPIAAVAAVTKNLIHATLWSLAAIVGSIGVFIVNAPSDFTYSPQFLALAWVDEARRAAVILTGTVAVLAVQYWRRDTQLCRLFLVATFLLSLFPSLPFGVKWVLEELSSPQRVDAASGRIGLDPQRARRPWPPPPWPRYGSFVWLEIPVRFERLPSGSIIEAIAVKAMAQTSTTYDSKLGWLLADNSQPGWLPTQFHEVEDGAGFVSMFVTPGFYSTAYRRPVHLYGTLDLMVFRLAQTVGLPGRRSVDVPGIGECASQQGTTNVMLCNTILPSSRVQILSNGRPAGHPEENSPNLLAPFPLWGVYSPLTPFKVTVPPDALFSGGQIQLEIQRPVAYIHRAFDFQNIHLDDYIMPPPAETARH